MKHTYRLISLVLLFACASCRHTAQLLPEKDYVDFVRHIMEAAYLDHPSPDVFDQAFDKKAFTGRILAIGDIPSSKEKELRAFLDEYFSPGKLMLQRVENGADYMLTRIYMRNDTAHAIFRIYDGSVYLEDWTLATDAKGNISVEDIYVPISGIHWSDEWNMNACVHFDISSDHFFINEKLIGINQLLKEGQFEKADSLFSWIEQATQTNLYAQTLRLNMVSQSQDFDSLLRYCDHFLKLFPGRKEITTFYCLQNAISHGMMPKVTELCEQMSTLTGSDPIFFLYKAWGYKAAGQLTDSKRMIDSLIYYIPIVYDFYNYELDILYELHDAEGFAAQLERSDSLFSASDEDIPYYESTYPEMSRTAPFLAWKEKHLKKLANEINGENPLY